MNQLNRYTASAKALTNSGAGRGVRRLVFWVLLVVGLLVAALVAGAVAIGIWLIFNADAALAWLNGVVGQLGPIATFFGKLGGGG